MDVEKAGEKGFPFQIQDPLRLGNGGFFLRWKKQPGDPLPVYEHGAAGDFKSGRKDMRILKENLHLLSHSK